MSIRALTRVIVLAVASAVAATGCTGGGGESATTVVVTATDQACTVDNPSVPPGTVHFAVENRGSIITEVYLYSADDEVIDEVENIEPGAHAQFSAKAGGGQYSVACVPGQMGDGIRTELVVTGPTIAGTPPDRATARGVDAFAVAVAIDDDGFGVQFDDLVVVAYQTITFELTNAGTVVHAFAVFGADGATELGRSGPVEPGARGSVAVAFHETGKYTAVDPHAPDLTSTFEVVE